MHWQLLPWEEDRSLTVPWGKEYQFSSMKLVLLYIVTVTSFFSAYVQLPPSC